MSAIAVSTESPLQTDVRGMIAALNAHLRPLSPPEFQFQMTAEEMADGSTTLFVARDPEGIPLGMGALKVHDDGLGEVKRMFTRPEARGRGIGGEILEAVEVEARRHGLTRLALETGATEGFEAAWHVYERAGFRRCGAFLDYPESGYSAFFEKTLAP